jgi:hypothetical protein
MLIRGVSTLSKAQDAPLRGAIQQELSTGPPSVLIYGVLYGVPSEKAIKKQGSMLLKVRNSAQEVRD